MKQNFSSEGKILLIHLVENFLFRREPKDSSPRLPKPQGPMPCAVICSILVKPKPFAGKRPLVTCQRLVIQYTGICTPCM